MILHAQLMIYEWQRLATLRNWLMNALLSPSRKNEAEGNVRAALSLSSPRQAEPSATPQCGAQGTRTGAAPQRPLVLQHTLGLQELPIHHLRGNWRSVHVPCPDDGSGRATTRGANMKELWTKTFSLLLLNYLKSRVQIFWDKSQTLKIEISSMYSNMREISFTTTTTVKKT